MRNEYQHKRLKEFIQELKDAGFTVFTSSKEENYTWIHFSINDKIGYMQIDELGGGFDFSSVHKPCEHAGTGYSVLRNADATIENAVKTCYFYSYPNDVIKKYKNLDEYFNASLNKILPIRML